MKKGFREDRLKKDDPYYKLEVNAVEIFNNDHGKEMDVLVFGCDDSFSPNDHLTEREGKIVMTIIQWLGTPVGQGFIDKLKESKK